MTAKPHATCPNCGPCVSHVTDSRPQEMAGQVGMMRRRKCGSCEQMFKTFEVSETFLDNVRRTTRRQLLVDLVNDGEPL